MGFLLNRPGVAGAVLQGFHCLADLMPCSEPKWSEHFGHDVLLLVIINFTYSLQEPCCSDCPHDTDGCGGKPEVGNQVGLPYTPPSNQAITCRFAHSCVFAHSCLLTHVQVCSLLWGLLLVHGWTHWLTGVSLVHMWWSTVSGSGEQRCLARLEAESSVLNMGSYGYIMVICGYIMVICGYIMAKKNWIFFFYDFFLL